jgi:hypothetical protein
MMVVLMMVVCGGHTHTNTGRTFHERLTERDWQREIGRERLAERDWQREIGRERLAERDWQREIGRERWSDLPPIASAASRDSVCCCCCDYAQVTSIRRKKELQFKV